MTEPVNPPHWQEAMDRAGLGSRSRLGIAAGIPTTTITGLITGERKSNERTMEAVARALRLPVTTIREWAAQARGEAEPYEPPEEAHRLSRRQRRALDELIRSIVSGVEQQEPARLLDLAHPPMPELSRVAARRGRSRARAAREAQDRDAEDGSRDPDNPPHPSQP